MFKLTCCGAVGLALSITLSLPAMNNQLTYAYVFGDTAEHPWQRASITSIAY